MKKKYLLIIFVAICIIVLGLLFYLQMTKTSILHIPQKDITRIYIVDGNTGNITDIEKDFFNDIYKTLNSLKLSNKTKVNSTGWNKKIVICANDKAEELVINTSTQIILSGYFYDIDSQQGDQILNIIDKLSQ